MTQLTISRELLLDLKSQVDDIDAQLASASGSDGAGKRAIANQIVKDNVTVVESAKSAVSAIYNTAASVQERVAVVYGLRALFETFEKEVSDWLTAQAEANKSTAVKPDDSELDALMNQRRELVKQFSMIKTILGMHGESVDDIADPKTRVGARGKRGPRAISGFQFSINGVDLSAKENGLSAIAKKYDMKSKELRDYLEANVEGLKIKTPPDSFEAILPNGDVLSATKMDSEDEPDDEDETEDETED